MFGQFERSVGSGEAYRPRVIEADSMSLLPLVGLFGTCGSPASTWRERKVIPLLNRRNIPYFNPQVKVWTPEMARVEAAHLASDEVVIFPISAETYGYGSLAEGGWAILSALLRGQSLGLFVQEDDLMPEDARRTRILFKTLSLGIQKDYPVFQFQDSLDDLAMWVAVTAQERFQIRDSKIKVTRKIMLPETIGLWPEVSISGTSGAAPEWRRSVLSEFKSAGVDYFDPFKPNWSESDVERELQHKLNGKVVLHAITGEKESFGALAESGLLALNAFVRRQAFGLYIEDFPGDPKSDTNRARTLVRAHIRKLNEEFPGIVYLAESVEDLARFGVEAMRED